MFVNLVENATLLIAGAFLLGWMLSRIVSRLGRKFRSGQRDPRDSRIRSLEAELRIAKIDLEKMTERAGDLENSLHEAKQGIESRDTVISHQQSKYDQLSADLKDSVIKTRELRAELAERATEGVRSQVKLREVETELEVAQASTELIATGILDYPLSLEDLKLDEGDQEKHAEAGKSAS
jgi:chromosome segregation ATPase